MRDLRLDADQFIPDLDDLLAGLALEDVEAISKRGDILSSVEKPALAQPCPSGLNCPVGPSKQIR